MRVLRISLTTAAPDALESFYCKAFGFEPAGDGEQIGKAYAGLLGKECGEARVSLLRLGGQTLELIAFSKAGSPYPPDIPGNDLRFQHFAIVVSSMQPAYTRLRECRGWTPITHPGPQTLPADSGAVTAFKFRDPDGHPLELLAFPPDAVPPVWQQRRGQALCLGIDHSAISVAETERSIEFYRQQLGFSVDGQSRNCGIEQARLDDLENPLVEVTALLPNATPPHLELLCYRRPAAQQTVDAILASNDVAATRLVVETGTRPLLAGTRRSALIHDPDGHAFVLVEQAS